MYYLVHVPQSHYLHAARLTEEERKNYVERLEKYDEDVTINYADDNLPFYDLDR
jgi:hypothetical protein